MNENALEFIQQCICTPRYCPRHPGVPWHPLSGSLNTEPPLVEYSAASSLDCLYFSSPSVTIVQPCQLRHCIFGVRVRACACMRARVGEGRRVLARAPVQTSSGDMSSLGRDSIATGIFHCFCFMMSLGIW